LCHNGGEGENVISWENEGRRKERAVESRKQGEISPLQNYEYFNVLILSYVYAQ